MNVCGYPVYKYLFFILLLILLFMGYIYKKIKVLDSLDVLFSCPQFVYND